MKELALDEWKRLTLRERPWVSFQQCRWSDIDLNYAITLTMLRVLHASSTDGTGVFAYSETPEGTLGSGTIYGFWFSAAHWILTSPVGDGRHYTPQNPMSADEVALDREGVDKLLSRS